MHTPVMLDKFKREGNERKQKKTKMFRAETLRDGCAKKDSNDGIKIM